MGDMRVASVGRSRRPPAADRESDTGDRIPARTSHLWAPHLRHALAVPAPTTQTHHRSHCGVCALNAARLASKEMQMVSVEHGVENKADAPAAAELLARVKELYPLLANNAAQGERDRRVVEESIQALTEAGLFRMTVPKRF